MPFQEPSNPWDVMHDDVKSYITLATALLGLTAAFGSKLLADDTIGRVAVLTGWVLLAVSIGFSIYASGRILRGIKANAATSPSASLYLNCAVFALGLGVAVLAFGAWRASLGTSPASTPVWTVAQQAVAQMRHVPANEVVVDRLGADSAGTYTLRVTAGGSAYDVKVSAAAPGGAGATVISVTPDQ